MLLALADLCFELRLFQRVHGNCFVVSNVCLYVVFASTRCHLVDGVARATCKTKKVFKPKSATVAISPSRCLICTAAVTYHYYYYYYYYLCHYNCHDYCCYEYSYFYHQVFRTDIFQCIATVATVFLEYVQFLRLTHAFQRRLMPKCSSLWLGCDLGLGWNQYGLRSRTRIIK